MNKFIPPEIHEVIYNVYECHGLIDYGHAISAKGNRYLRMELEPVRPVKPEGKIWICPICEEKSIARWKLASHEKVYEYYLKDHWHKKHAVKITVATRSFKS